ncbi:MAG: hypothetical protein R3C44_15590 [Chloroflexota bacterium]
MSANIGIHLRHLAWYAIEAALDDAQTSSIDAIYVGNMLAGTLSNQNHLGALVADFAGLRGVEALTVEAGPMPPAARLCGRLSWLSRVDWLRRRWLSAWRR